MIDEVFYFVERFKTLVTALQTNGIVLQFTNTKNLCLENLFEGD